MAKDIHDATFKQVMSDRDFFIGFCKIYLSSEIKNLIDFNSMKLFKVSSETVHSSIDSKKPYAKEIADILYSVNMKNDIKGLIFIHCEHYSSPKKNMVLKMASYAINGLVEYDELNPNEPLPVLVSIAYYHGLRPFVYPLNLFELFFDKELAERYLFNPRFVDLSQYSNETLSQHQPISAAEIAFKYSVTKGPVDQKIINIMLYNFKQLTDKTRQVVLKYAMRRLDFDINRFIEQYIELNPEDGEGIMATMEQQLIQKGVLRGVQQGMKLAAENMFNSHVDESIIRDNIGLPPSVIDDIKKQFEDTEERSH